MLNNIKKFFDLEIETLKDVKNNLDNNFLKAVDTLKKTKGKVIVSGMGKSGIIAQKIAATLTSTGTLAIFLDPAQGLHGDVGVVSKNDIVIMFSKSGESEEINTLIFAIKKIGAKIICITCNKNSTLSKNSDIVIFANVKKEACPLNLAPTSSTTAFLVIGDALAISLMNIKKFKPEDFAMFHPGGSLGKRLILKVSDIMKQKENNAVININDTVDNMLLEITKKRAGAVSVIDKKFNLLGFVTDFDIRKMLALGKNIFDLKIIEIMNKNPKFIYSDEMAIDALKFMENNSKPFSVVPVLDRKTKKVVGMIHLHDILSKGL